MQIQIFQYRDEFSFTDVRTVEIDGEIWFVGKDVADLLGYQSASKAISDHCREKGVKRAYPIDTNSGVQGMTLINEPNVYRLISRSRLPSAEKFEAWLFEDVIPQIRKHGFYGKIDRAALPNFIARYKDNYHKIDTNYFSVISEMYARLYIALEKVGYSIPDKSIDGTDMMPDISVGRGFASFLKSIDSDFYNQHRSYTHAFPDGRSVQANMYHIDALPLFIRYIHEKWIPERAQNYFSGRDPLALDYLPKLLS